MASLGHVAIGMAAGRAYRGQGGVGSLAFRMLAFSVASLLPDADVVAFHLGIPYGAPFGHRGASHSFAAAVLFAAAAGLIASMQGRPRGWKVGLFMLAVIATHGPLDAMTDGGKGVALLFPFSTERIFFPWRPIPVAPIGIHFLSREGLAVAKTELLAFAPFWIYALWPRRRRRPLG